MIVIAEKPSAAKRLADILLKEYVREKHRGFIVYKRDDWKIVPLVGHVIQRDFPRNYKSWRIVRGLLKAPIVKYPVKKGLLDYLKRHSGEEWIVATDYDREGELIGWEAVEYAGAEKVKRAVFSSMTKEEITRAFEQLKTMDMGLVMAAETRTEADLLWGAVLTRYMTKELGDFYSVGRVQTPTLRLIVEREREIQSFVPREYYVFRAKVGECWAESERYEQKFPVDLKKKAIVVKKEERTVKIPRPKPMDTTTFLREANKMGFSPKKAMRIAEALYIKGLISYPRTENQTYNFPLEPVVAMIRNSRYGRWVKFEKINPSRGRKAKDHPPIHPTGIPESLGPGEQEIYEMILRYFLATLYRDATVRITNYVLDVGVEVRCEGREVVDPGFLEIYGKYAEKKINLGSLDVKEGRWVKRKTKPPRRYSPGEVIALMEKLGLGTKSTRAEILHKLYERGYITGKRSIRPTEKGMRLVEEMERRFPEITLPEKTSWIEKEMEWVESGTKRKGEVLAEVKKELEGVLNGNRA